MRLAGKIAIVTGAGSGFGAGIATRYAQEGARVVVNDVHVAHGERVAEAITAAGGSARFCAGDVSRDADVAALVAFALATFGGLDIVVNNAGTTHRNQPMLDVSETEFEAWRQGRTGYPVVDAAMLYAVAAVRGVEALAIMTVSDLVSDSTSERISDADLKRGVDAMTRLACRVAVS